MLSGAEPLRLFWFWGTAVLVALYKVGEERCHMGDSS